MSTPFTTVVPRSAGLDAAPSVGECAPTGRGLRLCVVSFKPCWQDAEGRWMSFGGFPLQMEAVGSLFDDVTLLVEQGSARAGGLPLPGRARVIPLRSPTGTDARRKLSVLWNLPRYLAQIGRQVQRADVVHTPLPGDFPLLGMCLALLFRRRLLARYGGSWRATGQTTLMNRVTRGLMKTFSGGRNVMLATGEEAAAPGRHVQWIFSTALHEEELAQLQPDLDRSLFQPARLAYVGRLSAEKGVSILLQALALLGREGFQPLPQLTLIGDGPQRGALERLVSEMAGEPAVRFAGQVDRQQLARELSQQDLCVQPSLTEGFSKAWLDSLAHGLPVLASDVGAARGVLGGEGERGWLVPPGNVQALARQLRTVLHEPRDWPALRRRCREFVEHRTLEAWTERIGRLCAERWQLRLVEGRLCR